jgi:hypothetical protein
LNTANLKNVNADKIDNAVTGLMQRKVTKNEKAALNSPEKKKSL